ncbi:MAG: N-acetylglucosamine kinase [Fimbriimonadaceae bacterium]
MLSTREGQESMAIILGMDCGGTSSRALAIRDDGDVVFEGMGGPANWSSTRRELLLRELWAATKDCPSPDIVAACFAGLLSEEDRIEAETVLGSLFPEARVLARPDYFAAIEACPDDATACVIAGTGSLICSKSDGKIVKSGGRGFLIGDRASAFAYGIRALRHYLDPGKADVSQDLERHIEEVFETTREDSILATLYRGGSPAAVAAKLAKALAVDALHGHSYALQELELQSGAFGVEIMHHLNRYHGREESWKLYLTGGLWEADPIFQAKLEEKIRDLADERELDIERLEVDPLEGAVKLAFETFFA